MTVYTIGHGNRSARELVSLLLAAGVKRVVDVRRFPGSRRHPHFCRGALERSLGEAGLVYTWEGATLGGFRRPRPGSPHTALEAEGLKAYADHMATPAFREAVDRLLAEAARVPSALLCAERLPRRCHRLLLSDVLVARGVRVVHLIDPGRSELHRISPAARLEHGRLVYDRTAPLQQDLPLKEPG